MLRSPTGCLTLAGAASALAIGSVAEAQVSCTGAPISADECFSVASYSSSCTVSGTTYGSGGVCAASINAAIGAAGSYLDSNSTKRVLVIVGDGSDFAPETYDLSHDLSSNTSPLDAAPDITPFNFSDIKPVSDDVDDVSCDNATLSAFSSYGTHGCLIIAGASADSTGTTIVTSAATGDISLVGVSHLAFENLTFVKQNEGTMGGTLVAVGTTTVAGTTGYATMTMDVLSTYGSETTQGPNAFASVTNIGSGYSNGDTLVANTGTFCSTAPTIVLSISNSSTQQSLFAANSTTSGGTYITYGIANVLSYGSCTGEFAPNYGGPVSVTGGSGSGLKLTIAPHPGPLSIYNRMINAGSATAYVRAYGTGSTPSPTTSLVPGTTCPTGASNCTNSQEAIMATAINPGSDWNAVAPVQSATNANQWTITMSQKGSTSAPAQYLPLYIPSSGTTSGPFTSVACMKIDSSESIYINDTETDNGEDVVFKNVTFLGHSRAEFRGIVGGLATISVPHPAYPQKLENPTTNYNLGVQLINFQNGQASYPDCLQSDSGGVQLHGVDNTGPIWGNLLVNYSAYGTDDDSLASFNDVGGQSVTYVVPSGSYAGTFTANYPQSIVTYDSSIILADQSSSSTISNGFVRLIGSYITDSDILTSLRGSKSLGSGVTLSNSGSWSAWVAEVASAVLSSVVGCDPAVIGQGATNGNGCPILATVNGSTSQTATINMPPTFTNPP
jgi:hypothetical protein